MLIDPITKAALDLLKQRYGMPQEDIQRIVVESRYDDFTRVTVTLAVRHILPPAPGTTTDTVQMPIIRPAIRHDVPRGHTHDGPSCALCEPAARTGSRAPTNCTYVMERRQGVGDTVQTRVCGELIRWDPDNEGWVHASDHQLGPHDHKATPGY